MTGWLWGCLEAGAVYLMGQYTLFYNFATLLIIKEAWMLPLQHRELIARKRRLSARATTKTE